MNKKSSIGSYLSYIVIAVLLFIIFFKGCENKDFKEDTVDIDTLIIEKVIPGERSTIIDSIPYPVYIEAEIDKDLQTVIDSLKFETEKLEYALSLLTTKTYDTTYYFNRGYIGIKEQVQGTLLNRKVDINIDDIAYNETVITKEIRKYPKFSLNFGLETGLKTDFNSTFEQPYLGGVVGFRNKRGYWIGFGYNTLQQAKIVLTKDFITLY